MFAQQQLIVFSIAFENSIQNNNRYFVVAQNMDKAIRLINQQTTQKGSLNIIPYQQNIFFTNIIQSLITKMIPLPTLQDGFIFTS